MKSKSVTNILVLGANGMLGRTVFHYLKRNKKNSVWGTVRKKDKKTNLFFEFNAHQSSKLKQIYNTIGRVDYIINCIGILRTDKNKKEMKFVNAIFPHKLSRLAELLNINIIHISTDAVFSDGYATAYEDHSPNTKDFYGRTKLLGEPLSSKLINVRTSIIGFHPGTRKSLLEWALMAKEIKGYTNQNWSGSTTLQFAKLCETIIHNKTFRKMRIKSSVFHFSPLYKITKHDILKTLLNLTKSKKKVKKAEGIPITRLLHTRYPTLLYLNKQKKTITAALKELIAFEKVIKTYE